VQVLMGCQVDHTLDSFWAGRYSFWGSPALIVSMKTDIKFISNNFEEFLPHDVDFPISSCITKFDISVDIKSDMSEWLGSLLELGFNALVLNQIEEDLKHYCCNILRTVDSGTGLIDNMLPLVSDSIDTHLDGDLPEDVDLLLPEKNAMVSMEDHEDQWVNLLQLPGIAQESLELDLDKVMRHIMGLSSLVLPEPEGENQGGLDFSIPLSDDDGNSSFLDLFASLCQLLPSP